MAKSPSQPVNLPGARPLMNPLKSTYIYAPFSLRQISVCGLFKPPSSVKLGCEGEGDKGRLPFTRSNRVEIFNAVACPNAKWINHKMY